MTRPNLPKPLYYQCGTAKVLLVVAVLILFPILMAGFYEGRKAYWDAKVREMCAKDGGTSIFVTVPITSGQFRNWGGVGTVLGIPSEFDGRSDIPFFRRTRDEVLHEESPVVMRLETTFIRRLDGKLLGKSVHYFRRGGDFPSWAHESSFGCTRSELPIETKIFILQEDYK